ETIETAGLATVGGTVLGTAGIGSEVLSSGSGGDVTVDTTQILVADGGTITTSTLGDGTGGSLSITAKQITLEGVPPTAIGGLGAGGIGSQVLASGSGGDVTVTATDISAARSATMTTSNFGDGDAGSLRVLAKRIRLDDFAGIASEVFASGAGGDVAVEATDILATNGGSISTITLGFSNAGDIDIQGDRIELDTSFIASSSVTSANSGDVNLDTEDLVLRNGAGIVAGTFAAFGFPNAAAAAAGEVTVAADRIFLDRGTISTTGNLGDGGNLFVTAKDFVLLRNGSQISTTAGLLTAGGDGGNIVVNAPFVVGVLSENSDITANAFSGSGGTVTVTAFDIIGLEFQDELTPFSDITASSASGPAGITEFNSLTDINVEEGLSALPVDLADPTTLISQQCTLQASDNASEFTVVGRGGLPPDPSQPGAADRFLEDLGTVPADSTNHPINDATISPTVSLNGEPTSLTTIREAQNWVQDADGRVYLISAAPAFTVSNSVPCQTLSELEIPN
ncbi:MAG: hypothetical protein F6K42_36965, partial [Leptolyngbya sp. SIO1D8]|nr:hypothetical protein [Leptolyngbya sp. SIO1D8]